MCRLLDQKDPKLLARHGGTYQLLEGQRQEAHELEAKRDCLKNKRSGASGRVFA
jgi:hypothetical protein